jgi:predicted flap endonuclease-1-like 5' DNA nuclease
MPYTLSMGLLWVALAVLLGIVIGWLMRSVVAKRQIERARSNHLDNVELERLRARVAELEPPVASPATADVTRHVATLPSATDAAAPDPVAAEPVTTDPVATDPVTTDPVTTTTGAPALPDAAAVLERPVVRDDLTLVEGIGPTVAELCTGIGIQTWHDLAQTEVSLLRTMLHDAGPRFRAHDPETWPEQARLLAAGEWSEFRALTERLRGGQRVD